jgi:hypothetical protein
VQKLLEQEAAFLNTTKLLSKFNDFRIGCENMRTAIQEFKGKGFSVAGYGCPARFSTITNFSGLSAADISQVVDDSPLKQNMYSPGTNSPIKSIDALKEYSKEDKILFMPLAWNFFTEISQRIKQVRDEPQDLFLKYFPEVEVK